jgi:adenylate cyclase
MEHRLAAVAVVDAVGFSRAMALNEQATYERCKRHLKDFFIPAIDAHRGHLVKTTGDGLMAEFPSVLDAVSWAVKVQEGIYERNSDLPQGEQLFFRIGIDMGDVIFDDEDIHGDEVNTATRIEKFAEPGGVCLSGQVYHSVHRKLSLEFEDLGQQIIKGLPDPVSILRVKGHKVPDLYKTMQNGSKAMRRGTGAFMSSLRPSILVSPFQNLDQDPQQQYFCDGLTNDVTTQLSKFPSLQVLSAHTAFVSYNEQSTPQQLNRYLGIRYLLEGSVHRLPDRVRLNAQLIDAASDSHLWAESFERPNSELFDLYHEITQQIVATLASRIESVEVKRAVRKDPIDFNAYDAYLKGVYDYSISNKERFVSSIGYFRQAAQLDPGFARAWGYLGYMTVRGILLRWLDPAEMSDAATYVHRAVELDPDDYSNLWDLAFLHHNCGRFDQAEHEYSRAYALNPNDADFVAEMGEFCTFNGQHEKATELFRKAMKLNPHYPNWYLWNCGRALYHVGKYEQTIAELSHLMQQSNHSRLIAAAAHVRLGDIEKARAIVAEVRHDAPHYSIDHLKWRDRFRHPTDEAHWLDALRTAGLP